jgi:hypothetical protein
MSGILNLPEDDPETTQLLGRNAWSQAGAQAWPPVGGGPLPGWVPASVDTLPPARTAAHELGDLGWRGLQWLLPNITNPATYAPLPPPQWTPTAEGKLPSSDRDPRVEGVASDLLHIGLMAMPLPGAGAIAGAATRWLFPSVARGVGAAESLAARQVSTFKAPVKGPRPFELDYKPADFPQGAPADAAGRLIHDFDGRPIASTADIAGRRTLGGADEAVAPAELDPLTGKIFGRQYQLVPASQLPRNAVGIYDPNTGQILVYKGLPGEIRDMVTFHEVGHGLNDKAGAFFDLRRANMIPIKPGMLSELKTIYNDLNNSQLAAARAKNPNVDPNDVHWGTGVTPQSGGYSDAHAPAELMAEAVRAYLTNPNYIKSVAPKTAAALREAINTNPRLNKFIHLNSIAGVGGGAAAYKLAGDDDDPFAQ